MTLIGRAGVFGKEPTQVALIDIGRHPLRLVSRETRTRVQPKRAVLRYTFEFSQEGELVYVGDQTAVFVKDTPLT